MNAALAHAPAPPHILIVDDDEANREIFEIILKWDGFVVRTAASGEEALASVAKEPPDLVLLDIMMPGMNGYEVTASMKANRATESIPIMIVTAMHDRATKLRALAAGARDVLTKPADRVELLARVRKLLSAVTKPQTTSSPGPITEDPPSGTAAKPGLVERILR